MSCSTSCKMRYNYVFIHQQIDTNHFINRTFKRRIEIWVRTNSAKCLKSFAFFQKYILSNIMRNFMYLLFECFQLIVYFIFPAFLLYEVFRGLFGYLHPIYNRIIQIVCNTLSSPFLALSDISFCFSIRFLILLMLGT